jgi:hypothetical protein
MMDVPFLEEAKNTMLPNSLKVVKASLVEIPLTLGSDSQMLQAENVESPNSCAIVTIGLDEVPSTLG